uniref:Uncharacterized protein n=1 Tax=Octactis speculum TaxID=3111310 RepID=A0A7S2C1Q1_9STRA
MKITEEAAVASATRLPFDAPKFILGSASASRRALLTATGAKFDVMIPDIDEKAIGVRASGDADVLVRLLAGAKADALLDRIGSDNVGAVLLTGDQVVTYRGQIREKPRDLDEARDFIESYASAPCSTVGAICLHDPVTGSRVVGVHTADIHLAPLPSDVIDGLIEEGTVLHCAGGLMVEHPAIAPYLTHVEGGIDSVMGLSTRLLASLLAQL